MTALTMTEMRAEMLRQIEAAGGIMAFTRNAGMPSHAAVSLMLAGKRPISAEIANRLGYIAVTTFRKAQQ